MPEISRQKTALRFITRATAAVYVGFYDYTIQESSDIFYTLGRKGGYQNLIRKGDDGGDALHRTT